MSHSRAPLLLTRWRARRARWWAQRMIARGAVIVDTETTDLHGRICELAVVDAAGRILLESLVNPGRPISPAASRVHGLSDADVAEAPSLLELLPRFSAATAGRPILAYNAPYDRAVLRAEARRLGVSASAVVGRRRWGCLMRARAIAEGRPWARLEGGHRAAGDAVAASMVLRLLADPTMTGADPSR